MVAYSLFDGYWCAFVVDSPVELDTCIFEVWSEMRSVHMRSYQNFLFFILFLLYIFPSFFVETDKTIVKIGPICD